MDAYERTPLWDMTLAPRDEDPHAQARDRLRTAFQKLRTDTAPHAAGEIRGLLPQLTVHDMTHSDALWELASTVGGADLRLTPVEGFVLGCAFVVHDLGMGLVAFGEGLPSLAEDERAHDLIAARLRADLGRPPTRDEIAGAPSEIRDAAIGELLRDLHAERAESLLDSVFDDGGRRVYLLEDEALRTTFGAVIGAISQSHGTSVDRLADLFPRRLGAPGDLPAEWTLDPLKLACLLRLADACHLDVRRAPLFLRALVDPSEASAPHWDFQARLNRPVLDDDRLSFTAPRGFEGDDAEAWWLCYDTLKMVDRELREVDALLADLKQPRFAGRGVAGVEDPDRLTEYIPTLQWQPVDAQIHVTDIAGLVQHLGGAELYGDDPTVPLRELIQNASDAVRARRLVDELDGDSGTITVRLTVGEGEDVWIEVEDDGIGMSSKVLSTHLLDFGKSYWSSSEVAYDHPGLLSSGFSPTGRYGIGFFSVFMWSEEVAVCTRPYEASWRDTVVMEFTRGVLQRPIIRAADRADFIRDGGTRVRVRLSRDVARRLLHASLTVEDDPPERSDEDDSEETPKPPTPFEELCRICARLCPALDAEVVVECGSERAVVVQANGWLKSGGGEFARAVARYRDEDDDEGLSYLDHAMRVIHDERGAPIARVAIWPWGGAVAIGGLHAGDLLWVTGVFVGAPVRAARDSGMPLISAEALAEWASEQAQLLSALELPSERARSLAETVCSCGGDPGSLPVAMHKGRALSIPDIESTAWPDTVALVQDGSLSNRFGDALTVDDNVVLVSMGSTIVFQHSDTSRFFNWPEILFGPRGTFYPVSDRVALAIWRSWGGSGRPPLTERYGQNELASTASGQRVVLSATLVQRSRL